MPEGTAAATSTPAAAPPPAPAPSAPQPTGPSAPAGGSNEPNQRRATVDDRAAALKERLASEESGASEPAAGVDAPSEPSPSDANGAPAADLGASDESAAARQRSAERMERIRRAREMEARAEEQRRNAGKRDSREKALAAELDTLRTKLSELEPLNNVFQDEATLLAAAEQRGLSAEKVVEWMRKRLTDPSAVAQRQAKTVEDSLKGEIAKLQERIDKAEEARKAEARAAAEQREQLQAAQQFVAQVSEREESHPYTAALHRKYGAQGAHVLLTFANQFVVPLLPDGYTLDELHDHTEQLLEDLQIGGDGRAPRQPAQAPSRNGAGQPTTTLSNALAGERTTVADEVPLHKLSLDERVQRLKDKLSRG